MNAFEASRPSRSPALVPALVLLTLAVAAGCIGFAAWRSRERATRTVTLATYLKLKADGAIQEAWLEGTWLTARIDPKALPAWVDAEELRYIRAPLPPAVIADPFQFNELKAGLSPGKFHDDARR